MRAPDDIAVLAGLVGEVDAFADDYWGQRPLHRHAGPESAQLLSIDDVEQLLLTGARAPTFRLVRNGDRIPAEQAARPVRLAGQLVGDVADPERISAAVADGATLVVQALETTLLKINRLCRALEGATSHPAQANAYLTPAGAVGLSTHRDDHDVIVVQQSGTKTWQVEGFADDITLNPGDVLYMPAGTAHAARAQSGASLHLTIGLLTRSWASVVRDVIDALDDMRAPLPLGYATDEATLAAHVRERLLEIGDALDKVDATEVAGREARRSRNRRRPLLDGHLTDVLSADDIDLSTVVARRLDQPAQLEEDDDGDRVEVVMRDRRIGFPAIGRAALEQLLTGDPVRVGDLPGIDDDSKVVVVARLVRAALLAVQR